MKKILITMVLILLMLRTSAEGDMVSKSTTNIKLDDVVLIEILKPTTPDEAIFEDIDSINIYIRSNI